MEKSLLGKVNDFLNMEIPIPFKTKEKNDDSLLEALNQNSQQDNQERIPVEANLENTETANEVMEEIEDSSIHELENSISFENDEDTFNLTDSSEETNHEWGDSSWGTSEWGADTDDSLLADNDAFGNNSSQSQMDNNEGDPSIHHNSGGSSYDMDIPEEELKLQELLSNNILVEMEKEIIEFAEFELDPIVFERYAELEYKRYQPRSYFLVPIEYSDY
jgi:hypothetical protein